MASIFDRIRAKAQQAFTGIGNSIDRDQSMGGVQLAQGGLGNRIRQAPGNMVRSVSNTPFTDARGTQTTIGQRVGETFNNFKSNPDKYNLFSQTRKQGLGTGIAPLDAPVQAIFNSTPAKFMESRVIDPLLKVPGNLQTAFDPTKSGLERGLSGLSAGAAFIPGVDDAVVAGIQSLQERATGGNKDVLSTGYQPTPMGDILRNRGNDGVGATALDFAELPLMLGGVIATGKGADSFLKRGDEVAKNALPLMDDVAREALPLVDDAAKKSTPFVDANRLFKNWVNTREGVASFRADSVKTNPALTMFDKEGMKAITEMQSGANPDKFKAVKQFTDELFDTESKAGLSEANNYQPNYLPQLWENPPEEIARVFQRTFGNQPGFSKQRIFDTYKQGIDAGLTPKFDAISDLLTSRSKSATRALADSEFTNSLIDSGQALPFDQAPKGWKNVPELQQGEQKFAVDPKIAQKIQNYTEPGSEILNKVGRFVSEAKQSLLSAGVPKTGWNFHTGVNIPARAVAARNNPFRAVVDTVIWNTFPGEAVKSVDRIPVDIREGLIRNSLTVGRSVDDAGYGFKPEVGKGIISKARGTFDKLFSEAAFDKVLPAQKYQVAVEAYQKALKSGVNKEDALRIGAETSNSFFGGVNAQELGRSKDFQNIMRTFLLAPDWLESNFKIAKKTSGALLNPSNWSKAEYAPYRQFARNATFMYASMAMTNKAISGHWPWQNGAGQEFNLATGTFDERGRERMISPFGTAFDFARIPLQLVQAAGSGDAKGLFKPLRNRLSPPVGALANIAITGEDYRGRPIDTPGELGSQIAQGVGVPSQVTNIIGGLTGEQTPEEVGVGLLEAPIRYRGGANTKEKRQAAIDLKAAGLSNKEIGTSVTSTPQKDEGLLSKLFGAQASTNPTLPDKASKKQIEAFNKSIDTALEAKLVPNNQALAQRFFSGKSATSKSIEERMETYKALKTAMDDEFSTPEQKQAILSASGASPELYEYYNMASKDKDVRLQEILPKLDNMDTPAIVESLMKGRRKVAGKQLVTDEMVSYLYENDYISKDEQKAIKALRWDEINDKPYFTKSYTKSSGGSLSHSQAKKLFNVELPKFSRLKSLDYLAKSLPQGGSQRAGGDDRLIDTLLNAPNKRRSGSGNLWF